MAWPLAGKTMKDHEIKQEAQEATSNKGIATSSFLLLVVNARSY